MTWFLGAAIVSYGLCAEFFQPAMSQDSATLRAIVLPPPDIPIGVIKDMRDVLDANEKKEKKQKDQNKLIWAKVEKARNEKGKIAKRINDRLTEFQTDCLNEKEENPGDKPRELREPYWLCLERLKVQMPGQKCSAVGRVHHPGRVSCSTDPQVIQLASEYLFTEMWGWIQTKLQNEDPPTEAAILEHYSTRLEEVICCPSMEPQGQRPADAEFRDDPKAQEKSAAKKRNDTCALRPVMPSFDDLNIRKVREQPIQIYLLNGKKEGQTVTPQGKVVSIADPNTPLGDAIDAKIQVRSEVKNAKRSAFIAVGINNKKIDMQTGQHMLIDICWFHNFSLFTDRGNLYVQHIIFESAQVGGGPRDGGSWEEIGPAQLVVDFTIEPNAVVAMRLMNNDAYLGLFKDNSLVRYIPMCPDSFQVKCEKYCSEFGTCNPSPADNRKVALDEPSRFICSKIGDDTDKNKAVPVEARWIKKTWKDGDEEQEAWFPPDAECIPVGGAAAVEEGRLFPAREAAAQVPLNPPFPHLPQLQAPAPPSGTPGGGPAGGGSGGDKKGGGGSGGGQSGGGGSGGGGTGGGAPSPGGRPQPNESDTAPPETEGPPAASQGSAGSSRRSAQTESSSSFSSLFSARSSVSVPTAPRCGDGRISGAEQCDDGNNVNGDGCSALCLIEARCGDSIIQAGEECDDGNTAAGDGCSSACVREARCGDRIVQAGEECDEGGVTTTCRADCRRPRCGDGNLDSGEECDAGPANSNAPDSQCRSDCRRPRCGDGVRDTGEQCDDGNTRNNDGCSSCRLEEIRCGNGRLEGAEQCDDGNNRNGDGCSALCGLEPGTRAFCGDRVVQRGEQCDDGNDRSGDGCLRCRIEGRERCGDGRVDAGEQCDDGNLVSGDGCNNACFVENFCGNGQLNGSEQCDDGNLRDGDGCSRRCILEGRMLRCGDSIVTASEQCDDGNTRSGDGCSAVCRLEQFLSVDCGNGRLEAGEECDDGNLRELDGCSIFCALELGGCGDGFVQVALGEQCEPSQTSPASPYACSEWCRFVLPACGDGILQEPEQCDLGTGNAETPDAACREDCSLARCGDLVLDPASEQCDDGNVRPGDGCDRNCQREDGAAPPVATIPFQPVSRGPIAPPPPAPPREIPPPPFATQPPVAATGPATVVLMAMGGAAGAAWMRRRR